LLFVSFGAPNSRNRAGILPLAPVVRRPGFVLKRTYAPQMAAARSDPVSITNGFWQMLQQQVGQVTLGHIYNEMRHQGHLDALRLDQRMHRGRQESSDWYWGGSIFWDSDVAKWLEAASAYLQHHKDPKLETLVDG